MREAHTTVIVKDEVQNGTDQSFVGEIVKDPERVDKISKIV